MKIFQDLFGAHECLNVKTAFTYNIQSRVERNPFFKAQPSGSFWGFIGFLVFIGFLDKQEKIGKIIQKLSNLKP